MIITDRAHIQLVVKREFLQALKDPIARGDIEQLAKDVDAAKFGKDGSLARAIKSGGAPGVAWAPLTEQYLKAKKRYLGRDWPGEQHPPRKGISTAVWIRTGKALQLTETEGSGKFKKVSVKWRNFALGNSPFYEVFVRKIDYVEFADNMRRLFYWYPEDKKAMQSALNQMVKSISARFNLKRDAVRVAKVR